MADGQAIGKAYLQIVPTAKGMRGALASLVKPDADQAGQLAGSSIASKLKTALVTAGIGAAVAGIFKSAIDEGAKLEQSIGGIETLFKGSASQMETYAKQAFKTAGLSANEYMEQATSFAAGLIKSTGGDTKKAADIANMAMIDMSDNMNKMGSNAEDIQNAYQGFAKQNYTMLDNLKLGYGGTKEEMQRLLADAQELTGVKYDIDNLSDVYSAIHAIQENLGITGTTAKEASTTFSGSFGMMKASAQNLLGYMANGMDIGPAVKDLVESASTFIFGNAIPMIGRIAMAIPGALVDGLKTAIPMMITKGKEMIQALGQGMAEEFPALAGIFNNLLPIIETIGGAIGAWKIAEMLMKIPAAISTVFGPLSSFIGMVASAGGGLAGLGSAIMTLIGGPITLITAAIASLVAGFMHLWETNEGFRNAMGAIWEEITGKIGEFCQGIVDRINALGFDFQTVTDVLKAIWDGFCQVLAPVFEVAFQLISDVLSAALDILTGLLDMFIGKGTLNWDQFWKGMGEILLAAGDLILNIFQNALNLLGDVLNVFLGWFGTSWHDLWNSASATLQNIWKSITDFINSTLTSIKNFITNIWNGIQSTTSNIWNGIKGFISSILNAIFSTISNIFNSIKNTISNVINGIRNGVQSGFNAVKNNIISPIQGAYSSVSSIFGNIQSSISSKINGARDAVSSAISRIRSAFNFSWHLPHLSLPHISISGSFSLKPPSVPHFGISWYAKAMNAGMILDDPTIFGFDGSNFLAGGEAGPEAVVGVQSLMSMIGDAVKGSGGQIDYDALAAVVTEAIRNLTLEVSVDLDGRLVAKGIARDMDKELQRLAVAR